MLTAKLPNSGNLTPSNLTITQIFDTFIAVLNVFNTTRQAEYIPNICRVTLQLFYLCFQRHRLLFNSQIHTD